MQRPGTKALIVVAVGVVAALFVWQLGPRHRAVVEHDAKASTEDQYRALDALIAQGKLGAAHDELTAVLATNLIAEDRARLLLRFGRVLIAAGDSTAALAFAKASSDPQAARTAISLYQAMPKLDRTDYDAMLVLATPATAPATTQTATTPPAPGSATAPAAP